MRRLLAIALVALVPVAVADNTRDVTPAEQQATRASRGKFDNVLHVGGANPAVGVGSSAAMFSGHQSNLASAPAGTGDQGQQIRLISSGFGQSIASDVPVSMFATDAVQRAREIVSYEARLDAGKDPNEAAFRYLALLYSRNPSAGDQITARFTTMASLWTDTERNLALDAERILRDAIKYAPTDRTLRGDLLDIEFNRAMAEMILARNKLVDVNRQRLFPSVPGQSTLQNEIDALEDLLPLYDAALQPYSELLQDPLGVDLARFRPDVDPMTPYGALLLIEEQPLRSQQAASFVENGVVKPVEDENGQPIGEIFSGYKDLVLMFEILADKTQAAAELARRYAMRAQGSDLQEALDLIGETQRNVYLTGALLLGLFPGFTPAPGDASGIAAAINGWESGLAELDTVREFVMGDANILGFSDDFLMLVQPYPPNNPTTFDSFDALDAFVQENSTAPLTRAVSLHNQAVSSYDAYQGTLDQLATEFGSQTGSIEDRIRQIVGARPGEPGFETPEENVGSELWQQRQSIEVAKLRIQRNDQQIADVYSQIQNEISRRSQEAGINASIHDLYIDYGNRQGNLTGWIGAIMAGQAFANELASAADGYVASVGLDTSVKTSAGVVAHAINAVVQAAAEVGKSQLQRQKELLAAQQQADITSYNDMLLDINSKAKIADLTLQLNTLGIDSLEAALLFAQEEGRRAALYDELADALNQLDQTVQGLSERYFADPIHQLRFQNATLRAGQSFQEAQLWVYFMTRALEYKWNQPFAYTTAGGESFDSGSVFRTRNALDLEDLVAAMESYDAQINAPRQLFSDWFSIRDNVFGLIPGPQGNPNMYVDPVTGDLVDGITLFRRTVQRLTNGGNSFTIRFDTSHGNLGGNLFLGPVFDDNGNIVGGQYGAWNDKIDFLGINLLGSHTVANTTVSGQLEQGGTLFVRNPSSGDFAPSDPSRLLNEFSAFTSRFWYNTGSGFQFTEALTTPVTMRLTTAQETPPQSIYEVTVFRERSVASTDWRLLVNFRNQSQTFLNIDELSDIEVFFSHLAAPRQN